MEILDYLKSLYRAAKLASYYGDIANTTPDPLARAALLAAIGPTSAPETGREQETDSTPIAA